MADQEFTIEELEHEEWRPVVGYESYYAVSSLGRVKFLRPPSKKARRFGELLGSNNRKGYPAVGLKLPDLKFTLRKVHRLVSEAFLGPCPEGKEVNHIDTDRGNARVGNLEYVTHLENMRHAMRMGRMRRPKGRSIPKLQGENSVRAKLTAQDVIAIRQAILRGISGTALANQYNVTNMTISMIKAGKNWAHLETYRDEVKALGSNKTLHRIPRRYGREKYIEPVI